MGDAQSTASRLSILIQRIGFLEEADRGWSLGSEEIRELLGIAPEEFLRGIYAADRKGHPLVDLAAATTRFSQDNIWEFVALVELFCGTRTEDRLQRAGIFFTHPEQLEILGTLVARGSRSVREHAVDADEFSAMLAAFGSLERARACYLEEHFRLDALIDEAAQQYCAGRRFDIPELARRNARSLLRFFIQKHVLEPRDLFARVSAALFDQAVREGYAERPRAEEGRAGRRGTGRRGAGRPGGRGSGEGHGRELSQLERACRVLELEERTLTPALLKSQYKRLMKRYHPDLNPAGLARCQEITAAYSVVVSSL